MEDAYRVQAALVRRKIDAGLKPKGWKIGLTSKAMQYALAIDTPDSGVLFDDMFYSDGATVPAGRFIQPRVEAEIAFVMKAPLKGPGVTIFDVLNATDYITPALEILDTRIERVNAETKKARSFFDTISDNAANAGIVIGGRPQRPDEADMRWIGRGLGCAAVRASDRSAIREELAKRPSVYPIRCATREVDLPAIKDGNAVRCEIQAMKVGP